MAQILYNILTRWLPWLVVAFIVIFVIIELGYGYGLVCPPIESAAGTGSTTPAAGTFDWGLMQRHDTPFVNGVDVTIKFRPDPALAKVGFVQIVRTQDLCKPDNFYYPSEEKRERATNGWYVDRWDGAKFPIFGMTNECRPGPNVTMGGTPTMFDRPYRPDRHPYLGIRWQAVVVPVPIGDDNFATNLETKLGYYYWSWSVTENGSLTEVTHGKAKSSLKENVRNALMQWWDKKGIVVCDSNRLTIK